VLRLAFEDNFFHFIAVSMDFTRDARFQGCSPGKGPDGFDEFAAKSLLVLGYLLRRLALLIVCFPFVSGRTRRFSSANIKLLTSKDRHTTTMYIFCRFIFRLLLSDIFLITFIRRDN